MVLPNPRIVKIVQEISEDLEFEDQEVSLLFTDNAEIKELNSQFRNKDKATDVLSFICEDEDYLGDLIISLEKAKVQAKEFKCSLQEELVRLVIHGMLHLHGFDHVGVGNTEAARMRRKEKQLMQRFRETWPNWL